MNLQQMMIQAQRVKRELDKALKELHGQEFSITKNGAVTIKMLGDRTVTSIEVDEDAFDKENREMVQELIVLGINDLAKDIAAKEEAINERITGTKGGLGF
ncbi:MAG: YbaB/EbfC family nucleoid-associated protein [Bacilli bacterium]|nr:YbaB/EbfC family nucleoid-associated protein [Bacilli bacterium]